MDLNEGLKKVLFASVGAVAVTAESAKELIGTFVEKGEKTVSQGKVINEELKRNVKAKVNDHVTVHIVKEYADVMKAVDSMTEEELAQLKEKISKKEQEAAAQHTKKQTENETVETENTVKEQTLEESSQTQEQQSTEEETHEESF